MLKKFLSGLIFGAGLAVGFFVLSILSSFLMPQIMSHSGIPVIESSGESTTTPQVKPSQNQPEFHQLSLDDQIKAASVIFLADLQQTPDGKQAAIITSILKKSPNADFYFKVGDEYPEASYYPSNTRPATKGSMVILIHHENGSGTTEFIPYDGDRIRGLGDIPIELFKNKCAQSNA